MKPIHGAAAIFVFTLSATAAQAQASDAKTFIAKAGASDLYEREASRLVLHSSDASVRSFAVQMIKDHTASTAKIKAAAASAHVMAGPPKLEPEQTDMISRLKKSEGAARDNLYLIQQRLAHQQALTLMKDYADHGDSPPLKLAAAQIVPVVQKHVDMLEHGHK